MVIPLYMETHTAKLTYYNYQLLITNYNLDQ